MTHFLSVPVSARDHIAGRVDAPIVLVEYGAAQPMARQPSAPVAKDWPLVDLGAPCPGDHRRPVSLHVARKLGDSHTYRNGESRGHEASSPALRVFVASFEAPRRTAVTRRQPTSTSTDHHPRTKPQGERQADA